MANGCSRTARGTVKRQRNTYHKLQYSLIDSNFALIQSQNCKFVLDYPQNLIIFAFSVTNSLAAKGYSINQFYEFVVGRSNNPAAKSDFRLTSHVVPADFASASSYFVSEVVLVRITF